VEESAGLLRVGHVGRSFDDLPEGTVGAVVVDAAMLEAKLCGVGILDPGQRVLLQAEKPVNLTVDGWSWLLEEKTYRRWLIRPPDNHAMESLAPATDGASAPREG
jgi:hypothetical protein